MVANIFGDWYWVVLAVIVLFGGSQLPKLARNSGEALKEFRKAHNDATTPEVTPAAGPVLVPTATVAPAPVAPVVVPTAEERITLTRTELDALLAQREAQAQADSSRGPAQQG